MLAFLSNPDDPVEAIGYAIHASGATNSAAAMTGALAGACKGTTTLPTTWLRRFHTATRLRLLADRLTG
ncbi:ADP-ribosylglycohydrolase family protein [Saccharothrix sp. NRRL B-16348]|uniref:ADP-ribosylglycohydrolase family protein n=1 Tax=Saccharothrix sp. NRRL B-16348 TaxID=1415542 RepID=UPI0009EC68EB